MEELMQGRRLSNVGMAATVAAVHVSAGDPVQTGSLLISLA